MGAPRAAVRSPAGRGAGEIHRAGWARNLPGGLLEIKLKVACLFAGPGGEAFPVMSGERRQRGPDGARREKA
ncbi:hypothetical protein FMEAI12_4810006 [Parafrankia sp. Ea1.12]|nr:hypothetical protein FMEAI12_4810006 [Parafrankia sp. Ea1.12]